MPINKSSWGKKRYQTKLLGVCGRLDEIQAMVLLNKLKYFKKEIYKRIKNGIQLREMLSHYSLKPYDHEVAYNTFPIILKNNRKVIIDMLHKYNIECNIIYPQPLYKQNFLRKFRYKVLKIQNFFVKIY